jgi:nitrate/TMAO reductase-like tetraheme cytochrome c subunit
MPDNNTPQPPAGANPNPPTAAGGPLSTPPARPRWSWRKKILATAIILVCAGGLMMGGAEYYTARPDFCRSCHVMEPYWQSWHRDVHGGKHGIRCVDCHYAPGERHTFHAKFKGLSQATSYFSGRWGASRPRAHVDDGSCLVSACHGDAKYMEKKYPIGETRKEQRIIGGKATEIERTPTVSFVHSKHLHVEDKLKQAEAKADQLAAALNAALPATARAGIDAAAHAASPLADREAHITREIKALKLDARLPDALDFARAVDLAVRFNQLAGLNCAACHGYDPSGKMHFAVDRQTCYTCHFTNQAFNTETGKCLNCHTPPTRQILVHASAATPGTKPSIMNHQDILDRNIDCSSCHLDLVQGPARVSTRECTHCHDRASYLEKFENRTIEDVKEYHRVHVAAQRARCPDCHGAVKHQLIEPTLVATSAGFLEPVIDNCQHCHPRHHEEQVELLMGVGGKDIEQPMPNAMFGSRLNCRACHKQPGTDFKGDPLIQATASTCVACHEQKYGELLKQWLDEMKSYLGESEKALARVRLRVADQTAAGKPIPPRVRELIEHAAHNIHMVKIGNGIHNRNFANQLLDLSDADLRQAMELLGPAATSPATATAPAR